MTPAHISRRQLLSAIIGSRQTDLALNKLPQLRLCIEDLVVILCLQLIQVVHLTLELCQRSSEAIQIPSPFLSRLFVASRRAQFHVPRFGLFENATLVENLLLVQQLPFVAGLPIRVKPTEKGNLKILPEAISENLRIVTHEVMQSRTSLKLVRLLICSLYFTAFLQRRSEIGRSARQDEHGVGVGFAGL